jgi:hypothetical protein
VKVTTPSNENRAVVELNVTEPELEPAELSVLTNRAIQYLLLCPTSISGDVELHPEVNPFNAPEVNVYELADGVPGLEEELEV